MSSFHFPAGALVPLLFIVFLFALGVRIIILSRRLRGGDLATCGKCGYAVRGAPGLTCPECGSDLREVGILPAQARATGGFVGYILIGVALLLLLMFVLGGLMFVSTPFTKSGPSPIPPIGTYRQSVMPTTSSQPSAPGKNMDVVKHDPPAP